MLEVLSSTLFKSIERNIMKTTVHKQHFIDAFMTSSNYCNNFSYEGLGILFDYLEQLEDDCGEELEFDLVAIACEYAEYSAANVINDYKIDIDDDAEDDEIVDTVREYLQDNTSLCGEYTEDDGTVMFVFCTSF